MIFAVALSYFEIGIVFIILGASLVLMGALAFRYLQIHVAGRTASNGQTASYHWQQKLLPSWSLRPWLAMTMAGLNFDET